MINKSVEFLMILFLYFSVGCFIFQFWLNPIDSVKISLLLSTIITSSLFLLDYIKYVRKRISVFKADDFDQDDVNDYILSPEFQKDLSEQITKDTWDSPTEDGKGLPKIYLDDNGDLVRHWKDGVIEVIEEDLLKDKR